MGIDIFVCLMSARPDSLILQFFKRVFFWLFSLIFEVKNNFFIYFYININNTTEFYIFARVESGAYKKDSNTILKKKKIICSG